MYGRAPSGSVWLCAVPAHLPSPPRAKVHGLIKSGAGRGYGRAGAGLAWRLRYPSASVRGGNFGREIMERERRPCGAQPEGRAACVF